MAGEPKYIDRGKDAPSTMLTPRTLALAQAQAEEFRKRAEAAEAELERLRGQLLKLAYLPGIAARVELVERLKVKA